MDIKKKISYLENTIAQLKGRWPAHSVKPQMIQELEELEELLERLRRNLHSKGEIRNE